MNESLSKLKIKNIKIRNSIPFRNYRAISLNGPFHMLPRRYVGMLTSPSLAYRLPPIDIKILLPKWPMMVNVLL